MSTIIDRQLMSLYVTLLLSVACLGYAELGQELPETPVFYVGMFMALGIAYWLEGRFTLSSLLSNALALVMLVAGFVWLFSHRVKPDPMGDYDISLLRSLVSRSGPILCSLLLAKLFRPKTASDQWMLQLLGLVQVILACVVAMGSRMDRDAPLFPVLMILYLASLAWAFRLFYLRHEITIPAQGPQNATGWFPWISFKPLGWFLLCLGVTVLLFFCMPQGGLDANFFQSGDKAETGATNTIDMNAEGTLTISDQKVMTIYAKNRKGTVQLPESLRLRGNVLSVYHDNNGKWLPFPASTRLTQRVRTSPLELQDGMVRLEFDMDISQLQDAEKPRSSVYANEISIPLFLPTPPQISLSFGNKFSSPITTGMALPLTGNLLEGQFRLSLNRNARTVTLSHDVPLLYNDPEWEQRLRELPQDFHQYKQILERVPKRVAATGRIAELSQQILLKEKLNANSSDRDKAKALEKYLTTLPYKYSLERRRQDYNIDPTEDFIFNVKEGHCERFASALVLMLRTVNVPARIIVGYRGLELSDVNGIHTVRQYHAHAWVEALVEQTRQGDGSTILKWMVVDASPLSDAQPEQTSYYSPLTFARYLWEFFILDFAGQTQRTRLYAHLQNSWLGRFITWWMSLQVWQSVSLGVVLLAAFIGFIWLLFRWRRNIRMRRLNPVAKAGMSVPFYTQLLQLLARHGWKPGVAETPAEFAHAVEQKMLSSDQPAAIAGIPASLVPPYYAIRYGAAPLPATDQAAYDSHLQSLRSALQR